MLFIITFSEIVISQVHLLWLKHCQSCFGWFHCFLFTPGCWVVSESGSSECKGVITSAATLIAAEAFGYWHGDFSIGTPGATRKSAVRIIPHIHFWQRHCTCYYPIPFSATYKIIISSRTNTPKITRMVRAMIFTYQLLNHHAG